MAYKQIDGVQYEKELLDLADNLTAGAGDGRISMDDASKLLESAMDGQGITDTEKRTLDYIKDNYNWTDAAKDHFANELKKLN